MTKLQQYIIDNGLKQIWIADKLGIKIQTFNAIVNGKQPIPSEILAGLVGIFDCDPSEIYDKWPVKEQESVAA